MPEEPSVTKRDAQPYVAIATAVTMEGFDVVEGLTDEVFAWLQTNGVATSGSPFVRIVTSDMSAELDIEVGLLVDTPPAGDERFIVGSIPGGSYVTLFYSPTNDHDHYQANVDLQAWAANEGLEWAIDRTSGVDVWLGRFQFFRTDLSSEGHPVFELTYKVANDSVR
jgi:hypothetical protein